MKSFIAGTVFGIIIATVGFSGVVRMFDNGVELVKSQSQELSQAKGQQ